MMKMNNASSVSGSQALCGSHEAHGCSATTGAGGVVVRGEDSVAAVGLLVDGYVVGKASKEVQFTLDPAKDLLGRHEHLEITEAD